MKLQSLKTITTHPLTVNNKLGALLRFFKRGIVIRLVPFPIAYPFIGPTQLLIEKGMSSAELQIFTGLYDFYEMAFMLHVLNLSDLFVDVGANVGVYTVLASGVKKARTIALEPVPATFKHLKNNIALNQLDTLVNAMNIGVGEGKAILKFTKNLNSALNHIVSSPHEHQESIDIQVDSLDSILKDEQPFILKIDVEGYETKVIEGAEATLAKQSLKIVIIELNGLSNKYNFDESQIHLKLLSHGFNPYMYNPYDRNLELLKHWGKSNTIYIRDEAFIKNRLKTAFKFKVFEKEI